MLNQRLIPFDRCHNFRDLGGYCGLDGRLVRWRHLYRSMTPEYMSPRDARRARVLQIGLVIDFRGDRFLSSGPIGEAAHRVPLSPAFVRSPGAEYERFRLASPEEALPRLLDTYSAEFARALQEITGSPGANVLFHCRLGKDRTGVFAALLLKLLGVSDDEVIQDYLLTAEHETATRELLNGFEMGEPDREPAVAKQPASRMAMEGVLQRLVSQYGGAYGYFASHGVSSPQIDAFVETSLQPGIAPLGYESWAPFAGAQEVHAARKAS